MNSLLRQDKSHLIQVSLPLIKWILPIMSTVPVSGYVRYKNTDCFAPNVEILVNGASFSPNIFTDSLGKFVIDFDPGATARLTPKFEDHVFVPAFWDVTSVNSPIAGILFNDITTRKVSGQVAGGSESIV